MTPPATLADVPEYVAATTPVVDDELEQLRAIERPADHEQVDAYLAAVEQTLASARALGAAASKGNEGLARTRGIDTQRHTREALGLARRLGADTCASQ